MREEIEDEAVDAAFNRWSINAQHVSFRFETIRSRINEGEANDSEYKARSSSRRRVARSVLAFYTCRFPEGPHELHAKKKEKKKTETSV